MVMYVFSVFLINYQSANVIFKISKGNWKIIINQYWKWVYC